MKLSYVIASLLFGVSAVVAEPSLGSVLRDLQDSESCRPSLELTLYRAVNLQDEDHLSGESDVYIIFEIDGEERRSSTVNDNNNPVWAPAETFIFNHIDLSDKIELKIHAWDEDSGAPDEGVGKAEISDVRTLDLVEGQEKIMDIEHSEAGVFGSGYFRIGFTPHGFGIGCRKENVQITVLSAHNLDDEDLPGDDSDPYCILTLGGQERRTKTADEGTDPVWDETLTFGGIACAYSQSLKVQCWDEDTGRLDDELGIIHGISLCEFTPGVNKEIRFDDGSHIFGDSTITLRLEKP